MKSILSFIAIAAFAFSALPAFAEADSSADIKVASFNILGGNPKKDFARRRAEMGAGLVRYHDFDIFGTQEMYPWQKAVFLGGDGIYGALGRPCCTPKEDPKCWETWGNYIFYKKDRFDVLKTGYFWLSQTPQKVSKGWNEKQYRICNWAEFRDRKTKKTFFFFNLHKALTDEALLESSKLVVEKIRSVAGNSAVFLTGDFNAELDSPSIKTLLSGGALFDTWGKSQTPPYGPKGSYMPEIYNGGRCDLSAKTREKIDFIFVSGNIAVKKCAVITDNVDCRYPSDHLPITAVVNIGE